MRFFLDKDGRTILDSNDEDFYCECDDSSEAKNLCEKINDICNEKEYWKAESSFLISENSILFNEIHILREQGAKPSDAFENYLKRNMVI